MQAIKVNDTSHLRTNYARDCGFALTVNCTLQLDICAASLGSQSPLPTIKELHFPKNTSC